MVAWHSNRTGGRREALSIRQTLGRLALVGLVLAVVPAGVAFFRANLEAPPPTVILRDRYGRFLAEVGSAANGDAGYWPVAELSDKVVAATLAAEDRRFYTHPGVDPRAVARALHQNRQPGRRRSGASTLAMQVARLQTPTARTYLNKLMESLTALWLTARHGREAVLRHYLRIVPYGNRTRGIGYAARRYLDKPVADLSWAEAAFLAALPQSPAQMNPLTPSGRAKACKRAEGILTVLHRQGRLTDDEHQTALSRLATLSFPKPPSRDESAIHVILHLERQLTTCLTEHRCPELERRPIVDTTLDLELQAAVTRKVRARLHEWQPDGAGNAAVVVVDAPTSEVVAWVGSGDYRAEEHAGAIDFTGIKRSPGSALKPFFYALALERGELTPATVLADLRRADGLVRNADEKFLGPMLPRQALANSRNVPAVEVLERVGFGRTWDFLGDLGLHEGARRGRAEQLGYGMVLGNLAVSLEALVRAYTVFTREGELHDLILYRGQPTTPMRRLLSSETVRQVALFLADPAARLPTFPRMGASEYPFPVAIKTGTSSGYHDAWSVAWSQRLLVGVWVGHPDYRPMRSLSGHRSAAVLARDLMFLLPHADAHGLDDVALPPPRGFHPARLCGLSGKLATSACEHVSLEWFAPERMPQDTCDVHLRHMVDKRTGFLATLATPVSQRLERTFVTLPAEFAEWAASEGLPTLPQVAYSAGAAPEVAARKSLEAQALVERLIPREVSIHIQAPRDGMRIVRDPESPDDAATLGLTAVVKPTTAAVVWYVDGQPFATVRYPYTVRWPLQSGEHRFQARAAYQSGASPWVTVLVE